MIAQDRGNASDGGNSYRVMVVDDSAVIRGILTKMLESDPLITVVESASNGLRALTVLERNEIDVVVLDIEMPVMDGLTALPKLLEMKPGIQVIVASTLTLKNAEISLRCLQAGAADYLTKPGRGSELSTAADFKRELLGKVKALGAASRRARGIKPVVMRGSADLERRPGDAAVARTPVGREARQGGPIKLRQASPTRPPLAIAIGSSTGGPQALHSVFAALKGATVDQPIFITQHMPATFTALLAQHLSQSSGRSCIEASDNLPIRAGEVYVARGDYHMALEKTPAGPVIRLLKTPAENYCRPSVDPMLRSLLEVYGQRILVVILTGMGSDGLRGGQAVVDAGGTVIAQDEATSVVWGMPRAVADAGLCSAVLPLSDVGPYIARAAMRSAALRVFISPQPNM